MYTYVTARRYCPSVGRPCNVRHMRHICALTWPCVMYSILTAAISFRNNPPPTNSSAVISLAAPPPRTAPYNVNSHTQPSTLQNCPGYILKLCSCARTVPWSQTCVALKENAYCISYSTLAQRGPNEINHPSPWNLLECRIGSYFG